MTNAPIRRAIAADAPACAAVVNAWIDRTDWMPRAVPHDAIEKALHQGLPLREAYVVGDPIAGYISIEAEKNHIWGLYVANPGQGLGKQLIDQAKTGRDYLRLNTHLPNKPAHRFYEREGFKQIGEPWCGDDGIEEIAMEWRG